MICSLLIGAIMLPEYAGAMSEKAQSKTVAEKTENKIGWEFGKNLYFGLRNNAEVMELQEFLIDQGYYAGPVTGNFYLMTLQAVRKFQEANGVSRTGYFGPKSRAVANGILEKLLGNLCESEDDCDNILPKQTLYINTDSDMKALVGKEFVAVFRVTGGDGNYKIKGYDAAPGLSWTQTYCPTGSVCAQVISSDSITLYGTPNKAGSYKVMIVATDGRVNGSSDLAYGKAVFTLNISGDNSSGLPVIKGIKGPTEVKVGHDNTWVVQAYDPRNGSLSYNITWGDEQNDAVGLLKTPQNSEKAFVQTATFSHTYANAGVYTITVKVANNLGKEAKSSITVNVKDLTNQIVISGNTKGEAKVGNGFTMTFGVLGGTMPYQWMIKSGTLPPGLILSETFFPEVSILPAGCSASSVASGASGCVIPPRVGYATISGIPTTAGYYQFTIGVKDVNGNIGTKTVYIKVYSPGDIQNVSISFMTPVFGPIGTQVTLTGTGFTSTDNIVYFGGGVIMNIPSFDGKTLTFTVPSVASPLCLYTSPACKVASQVITIGSKYQVKVSNANGVSNAMLFHVVSVTTE